ncbi:hypothetical protein [Massilia sp.]|uniref:hypothetical protein n=1 Tax=Massilia sp. TaxID=1882437 RepID=UPI0028B0AF65|nr:hypothetical protein [Massilia sp.]
MSELTRRLRRVATLFVIARRTDHITASRVDLALIQLPAITWMEVSCMLALSGGPADVAARVLFEPDRRRPADQRQATR